MQPSFQSFSPSHICDSYLGALSDIQSPPLAASIKQFLGSLSLLPATLPALLGPFFPPNVNFVSCFALPSFAAFYTPLSTPFPLFLSHPLSAPALPDHISSNSGFRPPFSGTYIDYYVIVQYTCIS